MEKLIDHLKSTPSLHILLKQYALAGSLHVAVDKTDWLLQRIRRIAL